MESGGGLLSRFVLSKIVSLDVFLCQGPIYKGKER